VELLEVRHSVFIVGNAGTGKSQVWRTLFKTYQNLRLKPVYFDLNPKVVTNDELFGVINPATREWRDGNEKLFLFRATYALHLLACTESKTT
jgi:dynein heavy chain